MFQPELINEDRQQDGAKALLIKKKFRKSNLGKKTQGHASYPVKIGNICSFPYTHLKVTPYEP